MTNTPIQRAYQSLQGLSVGDAFGQQYFYNPAQRQHWIDMQTLPPAPWHVTDDTLMSCAVVSILEHHQHIEQDAFAAHLAHTYIHNHDRGYGGTAHRILRHIHEGQHWTRAAAEVFDGMGSMGNGAAMRAGPIGAYYCDKLDELREQTLRSAVVTHTHTDAQHAALAVAYAASHICNGHAPQDLLADVKTHLPDGPLRSALNKAAHLPRHYSERTAVSALGNGTKLLGLDTVPLVLWMIEKHDADWLGTLWSLFSCGGDVDTTCAIAGSILAMASTPPTPWIDATEDISPFLNDPGFNSSQN